MSELDLIGDALGMKGGDVAAMCERIRQLRQTERSAEFLFGMRGKESPQDIKHGYVQEVSA